MSAPIRPARHRRILAFLGPGLITGASDDDPSGIATYAVAGASFGFATLWTAPLTFPLMAAVQLICARIGLVSGMGLAGVLRRHYPRALLYPVVGALAVANTINVGADLGAIAAALGLLVPVRPGVLVLPVAAVIVAVQVWGSYRLIERTFRWLTLSLFAYVLAALFAHPDLRAVARGTVLPTLRWDADFLSTLVAVLGTTISPYLFFWQASQEVEEEKAAGRRAIGRRRGASEPDLRDAAWDVSVGMAFSNLVMYFIILATAATLFRAGHRHIETAADAAQALRPLAGDACFVLFALGLIGTGFLAVPILSGSAAFALAEAGGWRSGLDLRPHRARRFYLVIALSTGIGVLVNFTSVGAITALFWTAVINGFLAPPLLVAIMLVSGNRAVMGEHVNGRWLNALGWAATAAMFAAAVGLVITARRG
ncbi:MAG TPA: divalent metal cation transporter [Methylomirabilota bacterium]|nr:divalent metal cation transporter [Methylomirabilota bacterium]